MGAFELGNNSNRVGGEAVEAAQGRLDPRRLREECIIALKVYDQCRQPDCKLLQHSYLCSCSQYMQ